MLRILNQILRITPSTGRQYELPPSPLTSSAPDTRPGGRRRPWAHLEADLPAEDDPWSPENYARALDEARIAAVRRADLLSDALCERDDEIERLKAKLATFEAARQDAGGPIEVDDLDRLSERLDALRDSLARSLRDMRAGMERRIDTAKQGRAV